MHYYCCSSILLLRPLPTPQQSGPLSRVRSGGWGFGEAVQAALVLRKTRPTAPNLNQSSTPSPAKHAPSYCAKILPNHRPTFSRLTPPYPFHVIYVTLTSHCVNIQPIIDARSPGQHAHLKTAPKGSAVTPSPPSPLRCIHPLFYNPSSYPFLPF